MTDIKGHIKHWCFGAEEDLAVASDLIERGRIRHGLFFLNHATQKMIKAHVCRQSNKEAPPVHNLTVLAQKGGLDLCNDDLGFLEQINKFDMEDFYPQEKNHQPTWEQALSYLNRAGNIITWLKGKLDE